MPGAMMRHPGHRQCECTGQDQKAAVHHGHIRFDEQCMSDIFVGVLAHFGIERFHLVGHSMGGLTALLLAHEYPDRVLSFVDIKGIAAEDCFLSRQIVDYPTNDPETFSAAFIERARHAPPMPARSMRRACGTRCELARCGGFSSRWWTFPIMPI